MTTIYNAEISDAVVSNYLKALVNRFYKILPIKENGDSTLKKYLESLQREMLGLRSLVSFIHDDDRYLTLLSIVQFFLEHDADIAVVRTDVFRAINILKKLQQQYCSADVG